MEGGPVDRGVAVRERRLKLRQRLGRLFPDVEIVVENPHARIQSGLLELLAQRIGQQRFLPGVEGAARIMVRREIVLVVRRHRIDRDAFFLISLHELADVMRVVRNFFRQQLAADQAPRILHPARRAPGGGEKMDRLSHLLRHPHGQLEHMQDVELAVVLDGERVVRLVLVSVETFRIGRDGACVGEIRRADRDAKQAHAEASRQDRSVA